MNMRDTTTTATTIPPGGALTAKADGQETKVDQERAAWAERKGLQILDQDNVTGFIAYANGRDLALFGGRRTKPDAWERHPNPAAANERAAKYKAALQAKQADKAAHRAAEAAKECPLQLGDVLCASWGYEQTNVDFYQVTGKTGRKTVQLRKLAAQRNEDAFMQGDCVPFVGRFVGEPFTARADSRGIVRLNSYTNAHPLEFTECAGQRIYKPQRWTAYA
jgi:hypothetical protein